MYTIETFIGQEGQEEMNGERQNQNGEVWS